MVGICVPNVTILDQIKYLQIRSSSQTFSFQFWINWGRITPVYLFLLSGAPRCSTLLPVQLTMVSLDRKRGKISNINTDYIKHKSEIN